MYGQVVFNLQPVYRNSSFSITSAILSFDVEKSWTEPDGNIESCISDIDDGIQPASAVSDNTLAPYGGHVAGPFTARYGSDQSRTITIDVTPEADSWATSPETNYGLIFRDNGGQDSDPDCLALYDHFQLTVNYDTYSGGKPAN
jgi:hypothetical protein